MRPASRRAVAALAATATLAGCGNPRTDANVAEAIVQVGVQISDMQQEQAILQSQVDSLRGVVAKQDTLLRQIAGMAGVPVR